jgi:hypothetical protein
MAVHQTRAFFLARDGHLVDNPRIGPDLCEHYWAPGNSRCFDDLVRGLVGQPLGASSLAEHLNRTADEAVAEARAAVQRLEEVPRLDAPVELDARIRVMHGREPVAELEAGGDFEAFAGAFASWVGGLAG